jgi:RNA polymerase sigma-70 factor (ECF subfamily)
MELAAERELIQRCLTGADDAWDELFQEHYAAVGRYIFQLSNTFTREDCDEICQEVFLSVIKNLKNFGGKSRLQTWLFRIAANKARDYRAKQVAAKRGGGQVPLSLQAEDDEGNRLIDPASPLAAPDEDLLRDEDWQMVGTALENLGGACQEILELRYFGDLNYREISVELDLNEKTVSSRLSKCRDKLETVLRRLISREKSAAIPSKK